MKGRVMVGWLLLGLGFAIRPAAADVLELAPVQAVVLPSQEDGWTRVALQFDLSPMQSGVGQTVMWAYVDWLIESPDTALKEFSAYPILGPWTAEQVAAGVDSLLSSPDEAANWILTSQEQERGERLLRLDLRDLAGDWAASRINNYGLVVATRDISGGVLRGQLANARLVIGYTFYQE